MEAKKAYNSLFIPQIQILFLVVIGCESKFSHVLRSTGRLSVLREPMLFGLFQVAVLFSPPPHSMGVVSLRGCPGGDWTAVG